jgi:hypothetical protein
VQERIVMASRLPRNTTFGTEFSFVRRDPPVPGWSPVFSGAAQCPVQDWRGYETKRRVEYRLAPERPREAAAGQGWRADHMPDSIMQSWEAATPERYKGPKHAAHGLAGELRRRRCTPE